MCVCVCVCLREIWNGLDTCFHFIFKIYCVQLTNVGSFSYIFLFPSKSLLYLGIVSSPFCVCEKLGNVGSRTQLCHWGVILVIMHWTTTCFGLWWSSSGCVGGNLRTYLNFRAFPKYFYLSMNEVYELGALKIGPAFFLTVNTLLTACSQTVNKIVWHIPLLCVQWKTLDDWHRNCPKHVEFYSKNKFEKLVHLVGFIIRIYYDAPSPERQISAS